MIPPDLQNAGANGTKIGKYAVLRVYLAVTNKLKRLFHRLGLPGTKPG